MRAFVGITDYDWYQSLAGQGYDEVNFWKPGGNVNFKALTPGELFLFKLHAPYNAIVGGGFFVRFSLLPSFLAWEAFGTKNGTETFGQLEARIAKYRKSQVPNPQIGCIILGSPFFFSESDWIAAPPNWGKSIVQGKTYDDTTKEGMDLLEAVQQRLGGLYGCGPPDTDTTSDVREGQYLATYRIGQGTFRVLVTEAYNRRCAISGEKTLPVLDAAHIVPFSEEGSYSVRNGLLLRTDILHSMTRGTSPLLPTTMLR
jgi:putative restriction endonuclease